MKTHYEVLNLDKNCSAKEIKDSFITLSKKYHPDKNKSSEAHRRFVEVNEAYSVLGKPRSRCLYDETLLRERPTDMHTTNVYRRAGTTTKTPYEYYSEMYARNIRRSQESNQGYFTRAKVNALCFCFFIMAVGSGLQIMAESRRRSLRSHRIAVMLKEAREKRIQKEQRQKQQDMFKNESSNLNPGEHQLNQLIRERSRGIKTIIRKEEEETEEVY